MQHFLCAQRIDTGCTTWAQTHRRPPQTFGGTRAPFFCCFPITQLWGHQAEGRSWLSPTPGSLRRGWLLCPGDRSTAFPRRLFWCHRGRALGCRRKAPELGQGSPRAKGSQKSPQPRAQPGSVSCGGRGTRSRDKPRARPPRPYRSAPRPAAAESPALPSSCLQPRAASAGPARPPARPGPPCTASPSLPSPPLPGGAGRRAGTPRGCLGPAAPPSHALSSRNSWPARCCSEPAARAGPAGIPAAHRVSPPGFLLPPRVDVTELCPVLPALGSGGLVLRECGTCRAFCLCRIRNRKSYVFHISCLIDLYLHVSLSP